MSFGQLTEIRLYRDKGLRLIGPLPAEVQNYTSYAGVPMTGRATRRLPGLLCATSAALTARRCSPPPGSNGDGTSL